MTPQMPGGLQANIMRISGQPCLPKAEFQMEINVAVELGQHSTSGVEDFIPL